MANVPISNLTTTWNDGATTFTGVKLNVTDTASASGSLLMDLQVDGASRFEIQAKNSAYGTAARIYKTGSTVGTLLVEQDVNSGTLGIRRGDNNNVAGIKSAFWEEGSSSATRVDVNGFSTGGSRYYGFGANNANSTIDLALFRDAADTLAQRRTTNAQTFRIYNTYTDASNYERAKIEWDTNVLKIGTEKDGTGTARALELQTDGTTRLTIANNGSETKFINGGVTTTLKNGPSGQTAFYNTYNRLIWEAWETSNTLRFTLNAVYLQFGGVTSSFPALKRSSTTLQGRLADDSAFCEIQGKLTTDTAYTAGAPTATGYIVLYDSTGTAYKVPAEAV